MLYYTLMAGVCKAATLEAPLIFLGANWLCPEKRKTEEARGC